MPIDPAQTVGAISPLSARRWQAIYICAIILVCLPYLITFTSQLSSDDFILLYYYGRVPLWKLWKFFSPATLWTYHPLQDYYFAVGWRLSGIEPWAYRAMSLACHLATSLLLMRFGRTLTGSVHFGGWCAIVFAGQWRHFMTLAWAAPIATLESTFFTIATCVAFLSFLRRRRPAAYALVMLTSIGWAFSKETIIQLPLFLAAIYFHHWWSGRGESGQVRSGRERWRWRDLVRLLSGPVVLVVIYLVLYRCFVRNIYTFAPLGYTRAPISDWPGNVTRWFELILNPFLLNDVVSWPALVKATRLAWRWHVVGATALVAALLVALLRRQPLPLLGLVMTFIGTIPYFALVYAYTESRYHYVPMLGVAVFVAGIGRELWRVAAKKLASWWSALRIAVAAAAALWIVTSFFQLTHCNLDDRKANRVPRELYDFFASQTDKANRRVLFVVDTNKVEHEVNVELGWGLLECARLALGSDQVAAVEIGFDLHPHMVAEFDTYTERYLVRRDESGWSASPLPAPAPPRPIDQRETVGGM